MIDAFAAEYHWAKRDIEALELGEIIELSDAMQHRHELQQEAIEDAYADA